ncbi:GL15819 [Drosophila persimilis]|uniref:GL15819 n=1 Tax=Drosophila persimilis TaxID=7234 RepID=B4H130_DROPE|nr:GL15819 [Drosophila persimilis]
MENGLTRVRWSSEDISAGICLNAAGPRAYRHLLKRGFPFPSTSTLHEWSQTVEISPGPLNFIFELMEAEVDRKNEDKQCVLCFDEYNFGQKDEQETKKYVQVAMVQGLWKSWKNLIYYDFDKPMTLDTLHMLIRKLHSAEYHVVAMVSNMGPANSSLWAQLGISTEKTWFEHPSNGQMKVFVFADVLHLVKLIRNQFLDSGLVIKGHQITATTIRQAMNHAASTDLEILWKLTEDHLNVKAAHRQKIKLATQLLSKATASAIRRCSHLGLEVYKACETADFIELIHDWVEMFNVRLLAENSTPSKEFGKSLNVQRKVMSEMTAIMSALLVPNSQQRLPFQNGVIVNNTSLEHLLQYVGTKIGKDYLITSRISEDPLKHFFNALSSKDAHPNPREFKNRLRKYLLNYGLGTPA